MRVYYIRDHLPMLWCDCADPEPGEPLPFNTRGCILVPSGCLMVIGEE
jgi:hypothetical protein